MCGFGSSGGRPLFTFSPSTARTSSRGVPGRGALLWWTYSTSLRQAWAGISVLLLPRSCMEEAVAVCKSDTHFSSVLLPMPLGPMMQAASPTPSESFASKGRCLATTPAMSRASTGSPGAGAGAPRSRSVPLGSPTSPSSSGTAPAPAAAPLPAAGSALAPNPKQRLGSNSLPMSSLDCFTIRSVACRPRSSKTARMVSAQIRATELKVQAEIRNVITIWYLAAFTGDAPPKICPVIMPGMETKPMTFMPLIAGMRAAWALLMKPGQAASQGDAPKARRTSTCSLLFVRWSIIWLSARATPERLLLMSMPARGIRYCALYHGSGVTMSSRSVPVPSSDRPRLAMAHLSMPG
mmetsp:Transcript_29198/g.96924  ORF Transcript_29198/g.96924 Transcript_29198/m.96924 type:complete len:351 (+) Transcript_29198:554-1606(+)